MVAGRLGSTGAERFSTRSSVLRDRASSVFFPLPLPSAPSRSEICSSPACPPVQTSESFFSCSHLDSVNMQVQRFQTTAAHSSAAIEDCSRHLI